MRLEIEDVSKEYRGRPAVTGVTLSLGPGVLGLLGPNGAGKSSLMRIVATITRPSSGRVTWDGRDVVARPTWFAALSPATSAPASVNCWRPAR